MRKFPAATSIVIAFGFLLAFNNVATGSEVNRPGDVERLLGLEVAANSDPTMDGFAAYLARDGVEADLSAPGWYESREQYIDMVKQQFAMVQQLKATVSDSNVVTDGTLGCVATQIHISGMLKDGSPLSISFRALDAWKKIDGRWQYTQLHISYPLDPSTGTFMKDVPAPARGELKWGNSPLPGPAVSTAQAKREIANWVQASANASSVEDMLRYYGPDENLIFYDFGGQLRGREEIRARFEPIFAAARKMQVGTPASFVDSDGLIGIQISRHHVKIEEKDGGTKILDLRRSDCLRRVNGKWYSMLSMISLPTARVNWQDPKSIVSPTEDTTTHPIK